MFSIGRSLSSIAFWLAADGSVWGQGAVGEWWQGGAPASVRVTAEGETLAPTDGCDWWNGTFQYNVQTCTVFEVTRMSGVVAAEASRRARTCAERAQTDCVLNGEIGFDVPSAFVYDAHEGLRMVVAPRVQPHPESNSTTVRMQHPVEGVGGGAATTTVRFERVVVAEYLRGGSRAMETGTFYDTDAFCLQALRRSVPDACWAQLD